MHKSTGKTRVPSYRLIEEHGSSTGYRKDLLDSLAANPVSDLGRYSFQV